MTTDEPKLSHGISAMCAIPLCVAISCADPPRPVDPPRPSASSSSAPSPSSPADASSPKAAATIDAAASNVAPRSQTVVLSVQLINLVTGAFLLDVDDEGHAFYRSARNPDKGVEGTLAPTTMAKLRTALERSRFCSLKPPDTEPMTFTIIRVDLPGIDCQIKMAPGVWKAKVPELMKTLEALEVELCKGPCKKNHSSEID